MRYPFLDLGAVNAPFMPQLQEASAGVISSGRYIGGPEVEGLENDMRDLCGSAYAVGTSNGLDALTLIMRALIQTGRLHEGDGVIVPANTYIASMLAVTNAGLRIIPVDADPQTMNIGHTGLEQAVTEGARAMMIVHLYGRNAWDNRLMQIAIDHDLIVVEDAAQAIGCRSAVMGINGGHTVGALGHAAGFSFYPTKNIGALGDAGMVTTDSADIAAAVRALANYGSDRRYHNIYAGYNCRLDPIQAAMLRVKLRHLSAISDRRRQNAVEYDIRIDSPFVRKPSHPQMPQEHVWHQYVIDAGQYRGQLTEYLHANGVGTDIHYAVPPLHQPCYKGLMPAGNDSFPVTDRLADGIMSLPISEATPVEDIRAISDIINRFSPAQPAT